MRLSNKDLRLLIEDDLAASYVRSKTETAVWFVVVMAAFTFMCFGMLGS